MAQNTKYKRFLAEHELDQKKVAEQAGITKPMINLIVNGYSNITVKTLKKLVVLHNISPNDILDWEKWIRDAKKKQAEK